MIYNSEKHELSLKMGLDLAYELRNEKEIPVFMCVGSDRVVGDALAPIVSEYLIKKFKVNAFVYGTLSNPINSKNVESAYEYIKLKHPNSKIIVVDATLSYSQEMFCVKMQNCGVIPAGFFNKKLKIMGDISLIGVVGNVGMKDYNFINNIGINSILKMAYFMAQSINFALKFAKQLSS